ncbi:testis-expressed protein 2 [Selaginella moellendorffii]|nr:testis-expressed protein 2 [Selaginella moellendorffii]|eukprot:XP_024519532.1 testis-expressed protein 2 [Selaginella moellendorffii]
MVIGYIASFLLGALALGVVEIAVLWYLFVHKPRHRHKAAAAILPSFSMEADPNSPSKISIEGEIWVASVSPFQVENANSSKLLPKDRKQKKATEQKNEISVSLKFAKLQDRTLILTGSDGAVSSIQLQGCSVLAVSSTAAETRKWAKKYPIKVEHSSRTLLGTTVCLLYFKTGWEKETWCEALRAAARKDYGPDDWYSKLKHEFAEYVTGLKKNYPEVFKAGSSSSKNFRGSAPATKKSMSWKRLLKKKKVDGARTKAVTVQTEDLKPEEPFLHTSNSYQEIDQAKGESDANHSDSTMEGSSFRNLADATEFGSAEFDVLPAKHLPDSSVAALNLMLSRLFFDLYHSSDFISVFHTRIQTLLSRIPTPSYISPITCSRVDIGKSCPVVHGLRALPLSDDTFGVEADIEYTGGAVLTLETRLDMRESRVGVEPKNDTSSAAAATADIINKSLETVEDDLEVAGEGSGDQGGSGSAKRKRWSQWKAFLSSVADQVSQVPLTLSMRVVSIKGTLQLRIKASPSDRIWYSFSSMPALELFPEPSVGDHKITTGPLITYIAERIQILVHETMVYPNSEDIHIRWMVSDDGNWVQQSAAPFPQNLAETKPPEKPREGSNHRNEASPPEVKDEHERLITGESSGGTSELEKPLLDRKIERDHRAAREVAGAMMEGSGDFQGAIDEDSSESKRKKGTRREKMLSLGKKFEEKTRLFAEKMRERFDKES